MLGTRSRETKTVSRSLLRDLAADLDTKWSEQGKILGLANSLLNYFDMEYLSQTVVRNTIRYFIHISKQTYKATLTYFYR